MPGDAELLLLEKSKCSECRELPKGHVFQCVEGHIFCDQCFSISHPCRVCDKPFPCEIRNSVLEGMLDSVKLECAHKWNGCEMKVGRQGIRTHVETCIFRQYVPLCSQMGLDCPFHLPRNNVQAVVDHFRENHMFQEVRTGTPFSLILQDFQACAKLPTKTLWPPLLVKAVVGEKLAPLLSVIFVSTTTTPADNINNSLSIASISLADFYPMGHTEIQPRAQFSIKCVSDEEGAGLGSLPSLAWTVVPFPSMNCKELLSSAPIRNPIPFLLSRYLKPGDGSLTIECEITSYNSELDGHSVSNISISVERVPRNQQVGWEEESSQQILQILRGHNTSGPNGRGRANSSISRGRRSTTGNNGAVGSGASRGRGGGAGAHAAAAAGPSGSGHS